MMRTPNQLRRAFEDLVAQIAESGYVPDAVFPAGDPKGIETIGEFLARFVGCEDRLRVSTRNAVREVYVQCFGATPPESRFETYAKSARRIGEVRRERSGLTLQ
jgi:hypothetical protein